MRLSAAAEPTDSQPLAPGMGLKFLRDGQDSANLVAVYSVDGQGDNWNFFANTISNHGVDPQSSMLKALGQYFSLLTPYINQVGLKDFAKPASGKAKYPYQLNFVPSAAVKNMFPSKVDKKDDVFLRQLPTIPANTVIYDVQALENPVEMGGKWETIGSLQLNG